MVSVARCGHLRAAVSPCDLLDAKRRFATVAELGLLRRERLSDEGLLFQLETESIVAIPNLKALSLLLRSWSRGCSSASGRFHKS